MKSTYSLSASAAATPTLQSGAIPVPRADIVNSLLDFEKRMEALKSKGEGGSVILLNSSSKLAQLSQSTGNKGHKAASGAAQSKEDTIFESTATHLSNKDLKAQAHESASLLRKANLASIEQARADKLKLEVALFGAGAHFSSLKRMHVVKAQKPLTPDNIAHPDNQKKW